MSEYWVKHSLTHIGKFRYPGDNGVLSTFSCLRTDFLHSPGRRGECNLRANITPLTPVSSYKFSTLNVMQLVTYQAKGGLRSDWQSDTNRHPPPPPWKASFLSDEIIGKKTIDFRSWTLQLRIKFVIILYPYARRRASAPPSERHFHTEPPGLDSFTLIPIHFYPS